MSSNVEKGTVHCILDSPDDWSGWKRQFVARAKDLELWDEYIDPDQPETSFTKKPKYPNVADYEPRPATRAGSVTSGTNTVETGDGPTSASQLSTSGQAAYKLDLENFQLRDKLYNKEKTNIKDLRNWVSTTVSLHYSEICCDPSDNIRKWYDNLQKQVGTTTFQTQQSARDQYTESLKPIARVNNWKTWLNNWEKAIAKVDKTAALSTETTATWIYDFFKAVKPVANHWVTMYRFTQKKQIELNTLTYRDVANDFREMMSSEQPLRGNTHVKKGAFGPSFAEQDTPDQGTGGDAYYESAEVLPQRHKRAAKRSKQAVEADHDQHDRPGGTCTACSQKHHISKCFYVFPDKAPKWFKERPEIRTEIDQRINTDADFKDQLQRLKGKRPRLSQTPQRSNDRSSSSREVKVSLEDD
jgi:hypothetical protein